MTYRLPRSLGLGILALGLLVALTPKALLPICEHQALGLLPTDYRPSMRCFWFGQAEILLGLCVMVAGLTLALRPRPDAMFCVGTIVPALGGCIILVSLNSVIGSLCGHQATLCQVGTKPAERLIGGILMVLGVTTLLLSYRDPRRQ